MVQHLSDGAPAARRRAHDLPHGQRRRQRPAAPTVRDRHDRRDPARYVRSPALESCYAGSTKDNAPSLGIIATEGSDVATLQTQSYSGVYRYSVAGGWAGGAPLSRGTVFTDRSMYQPGEHGEITGVAYFARNGAIAVYRNATYTVKLTDPNNKSTPARNGNDRRIRHLLDAAQVPGVPGARLLYGRRDRANGNDINGSLRVAEFKPPNFKLDLSLDNGDERGCVRRSDRRPRLLDGAYLFGAPLQGGVAHACESALQRIVHLADVSPDYVFGPQWFRAGSNARPSIRTYRRTTTRSTRRGRRASRYRVPTDLPFPMTYNVDVQTTDVSNLSVASIASFTAFPTDAIHRFRFRRRRLGGSGDAGSRVVVTGSQGRGTSGRCRASRTAEDDVRFGDAASRRRRSGPKIRSSTIRSRPPTPRRAAHPLA